MDGILVVDKPIDWTSHDVVNFVRKRLRIKKVGHGGTLDPIATGILVLFLGRATKTVKCYENDDKEYLSVMALGYDTFSNDGTGKIMHKKPLKYIPFEKISDTFAKFVGEIYQVPPMVSAIKVNGNRLYKMAFKGKTVEVAPRRREILKLEILHYHYPYVMFRMTCSKGTYVRKLCADIGAELGCGAYMSSLVRLRSGRFDFFNAVSMTDLKSMSPDETEDRMVLKLPSLTKDISLKSKLEELS